MEFFYCLALILTIAILAILLWAPLWGFFEGKKSKRRGGGWRQQQQQLRQQRQRLQQQRRRLRRFTRTATGEQDVVDFLKRFRACGRSDYILFNKKFNLPGKTSKPDMDLKTIANEHGYVPYKILYTKETPNKPSQKKFYDMLNEVFFQGRCSSSKKELKFLYGVGFYKSMVDFHNGNLTEDQFFDRIKHDMDKYYTDKSQRKRIKV